MLSLSGCCGIFLFYVEAANGTGAKSGGLDTTIGGVNDAAAGGMILRVLVFVSSAPLVPTAEEAKQSKASREED